MTATTESIYKISFLNNMEVYEIYAKKLNNLSTALGFIEISEIVFSNSSSIVVDPSVEKLSQEFEGVLSSFIPVHSVIRIDKVSKEGIAKIKLADGSNVKKFPVK